MSFILIFSLFSFAIFLMYVYTLRKGGLYEYPFLASATIAGFVIPQLIALNYDSSVPEHYFNQTVLMCLFCLCAVFLGDKVISKSVRANISYVYFPGLMAVGYCYLIIGGIAFFKISRLPQELTATGQWSGAPVALNFFAALLPYSFAIGLISYLWTKHKASLFLLVFSSIFYIDRILVAGKRSVTVELVLMILLAIWFVKGRYLSGKHAILGLFLGIFVVFNLPSYRGLTTQGSGFASFLAVQESKPSFEGLSQIDFLGNVTNLFVEGSTEMRAAVYEIGITSDIGDYDLGAFNWNTFVFNYVPAQLFGSDFKEFLMIDYDRKVVSYGGYSHPLGTTFTGFADSFNSFWYFGAIKFFAISVVMAFIYNLARSGNLVHQIVYLLVVVSSLHAITHHTQLFFSKIFQLFIFIIPLYWASFSSKRPRDTV